MNKLTELLYEAKTNNMTKPRTFNHVFDKKIECCLVCGEQRLADYKRDWRDVLICRCASCGFQFMNPQYEDNYIHQYYVDSYVDTDRSKTHLASYEPAYSLYLSLLERHITTGKLLDIGCGNGSLLAVAKQRGWQISGYDVDANSTKAVSERLQESNIFTGDFLELDESQQYDVITLHQVLEHVKNPNEYLQKIRRLLTDGGYAFIAVPNIHSVSNKLKFMLESIGIRRRNIGKYYDTYHHLLYFTPSTLRLILSKNGFISLETRNGYKAKVRESRFAQFVKNNVTGRLFPSSVFFVIVKKDH